MAIFTERLSWVVWDKKVIIYGVELCPLSVSITKYFTLQHWPIINVFWLAGFIRQELTTDQRAPNTRSSHITWSLTSPFFTCLLPSIPVIDPVNIPVFWTPVCPCQYRYSGIESAYVLITLKKRCRWTEICETSNENEMISNTTQSE